MQYRFVGFEEGLGATVPRADSQIVEGEELRDTAENYKHRNGEVHHATAKKLASSVKIQWLAQKSVPGSLEPSLTTHPPTHKMSEKSMADSLARCGNRSLTTLRWICWAEGRCARDGDDGFVSVCVEVQA